MAERTSFWGSFCLSQPKIDSLHILLYNMHITAAVIAPQESETYITSAVTLLMKGFTAMSKRPQILYAGTVREPQGGWSPIAKPGTLVVLVKGSNAEYVFTASDGYATSLKLDAGTVTASMSQFLYDGTPLKPLWPTKIRVIENPTVGADVDAAPFTFEVDNTLRLKLRYIRNMTVLVTGAMVMVVASIPIMAWTTTFGRLPHLIRRLKAHR